MTSSKLGDSSKGHEAAMEQKGDLGELLKQVQEMYKTFLVEDVAESKKVEPWRSRRMQRTKVDSSQEWQKATDLKQSVQNILHSKKYKNGDRLSAEDEMKVSSVFQFHPKAEVKTGPGIDYFKIDQIRDEFTRCFWVVRVDGTAVDFSFHKCLKAKLARESPHLVEQYESTFTDFKDRDLLREARRGEKASLT